MGNSGEGSLIVTVRYLDSNGLELAKTQVEGRIGSGFLGGTFDDAVTKAGEDVVKFTMENFSSR